MKHRKNRNRVFVGRRYRLDIKRLRCSQCRKKIGVHASFVMGHVVNARNPSQHGHVPICGPCFTKNTTSVDAAIEAIREVAARHVREATAPVDPTTKPN